jgi:hypothetical protein
MNGTLSSHFDIKRGTKQGDPLSTLLFNAVLEAAFRQVRAKWQKKKFGIEVSVSGESYMQSLCFADDVLLLAATPGQLQEMLEDLKNAAQSVGLLIHPGKSKVLTNAYVTSTRNVPSSIKFGEDSMEVLPYSGSLKWLGRKVTFEDPSEC